MKKIVSIAFLTFSLATTGLNAAPNFTYPNNDMHNMPNELKGNLKKNAPHQFAKQPMNLAKKKQTIGAYIKGAQNIIYITLAVIIAAYGADYALECAAQNGISTTIFNKAINISADVFKRSPYTFGTLKNLLNKYALNCIPYVLSFAYNHPFLSAISAILISKKVL